LFFFSFFPPYLSLGARGLDKSVILVDLFVELPRVVVKSESEEPKVAAAAAIFSAGSAGQGLP
jgi:hypothetical protein